MMTDCAIIKQKGRARMKKSRILYDENGNPVEVITHEEVSFKERIKNYAKECVLRALHALLVFAVAAIIIIVALALL